MQRMMQQVMGMPMMAVKKTSVTPSRPARKPAAPAKPAAKPKPDAKKPPMKPMPGMKHP